MEELKMYKEESSEEYELLFLDDDQNFVEDNREFFDSLAEKEKTYFSL
jgi:hypothetical protein